MSYCVVSGSLYGQQGPNIGNIYGLQLQQHGHHFSIPSIVQDQKNQQAQQSQQQQQTDHR